MVRILFIIACIWLFFSLVGKPLLGLVFKQANKSAFGEPAKKKKSKKQDTTVSSIIPDDVGDYVDFTEVKP